MLSALDSNVRDIVRSPESIVNPLFTFRLPRRNVGRRTAAASFCRRNFSLSRLQEIIICEKEKQNSD